MWLRNTQLHAIKALRFWFPKVDICMKQIEGAGLRCLELFSVKAKFVNSLMSLF